MSRLLTITIGVMTFTRMEDNTLKADALMSWLGS